MLPAAQVQLQVHSKPHDWAAAALPPLARSLVPAVWSAACLPSPSTPCFCLPQVNVDLSDEMRELGQGMGGEGGRRLLVLLLAMQLVLSGSDWAGAARWEAAHGCSCPGAGAPDCRRPSSPLRIDTRQPTN